MGYNYAEKIALNASLMVKIIAVGWDLTMVWCQELWMAFGPTRVWWYGQPQLIVPNRGQFLH